jgi:putative transposase
MRSIRYITSNDPTWDCLHRINPAQAWRATPKADSPPRPRNQQPPAGWDGIRRTAVAANGIVQVRQTRFHVTRLLPGKAVYWVETDQHLFVFDDQGTELMKYR